MAARFRVRRNALSSAVQVMYVALIGLQFMERIYIGPNEDQGMLHVGIVALFAFVASLPASILSGCRDGEACCLETDLGLAGLPNLSLNTHRMKIEAY